MKSVDWENELSGDLGVNEAVDRFYGILTIVFERYVPIKRRFTNDHSKTLLSLKNKLSRAHKRYRRYGDRSEYVEFCSIRNKFNASQDRAYQLYLRVTQDNLVWDPSKFWSYVNTMRNTVGYTSFMYRGANKTTSIQGR